MSTLQVPASDKSNEDGGFARIFLSVFPRCSAGRKKWLSSLTNCERLRLGIRICRVLFSGDFLWQVTNLPHGGWPRRRRGVGVAQRQEGAPCAFPFENKTRNSNGPSVPLIGEPSPNRIYLASWKTCPTGSEFSNLLRILFRRKPEQYVPAQLSFTTLPVAMLLASR